MNHIKNVISVWGCSGSGKTANSVKIASAIAEENHSVIVILPNDTAPMIPCICSESEYSNSGTLGSVFIAPSISSQLISYQLTTLQKIPNLAFLGFQKGENRYSYPPPTKKQCVDLIVQCSKMADFVIVDVSNDFSREMLSTIALIESSDILRFETLDIKNISYLSSNLSLLTDHPEFNTEKQIRLLNDLHGDTHDILKQKKNYDLIVSFCEELSMQSKQGNLLSKLKDKTSQAYQKSINNVAKHVIRKVESNEVND